MSAPLGTSSSVIVDAARSDDPVYQLALATAMDVGNEFLSSLVRSLHDVMPVSLAFVARPGGDPASRASAVFSWLDGDLGVPIEYELEGTPCELVYDGEVVVIPEQLIKKFPVEKRYESYCGVPLTANDGRRLGHFAVFSNDTVHEPKKVEGIVRVFGMRAAAELQRLEDEAGREAIIRRLDQQMLALHEANKFKSGALGMVAHDLRNPLAAIISRAELIQTTVARLNIGDTSAEGSLHSQRLEKSIDSIQNAADRMAAMIADLLDAARTEHDCIEVRPSSFQLSAPVMAAIGVVQPDAEAKGIAIDFIREIDPAIMADEIRLTEVIVNLLTNAIKYSHSGSRVALTIGIVDDGAAAEVSVRDQGQGMSAQDIRLAFQPYQTLTAKPTAGEGSTGLGLVIVKSVVEAHGGSVRIASDGPGEGTTFTIRLPV